MKKHWVVEAAYILVVLLFIGICIKGNEREVSEGSIAATPEVQFRPSVSGTNEYEQDFLTENVGRPAEGPDVLEGNMSAPVQDIIPSPPGQGPENLDPEPESENNIEGEENIDAMPERVRITNENYESYSNDKHAWWFQRKKDHSPSGSGEGFPIAPFDAYYLDTEASDADKVIYLTFDCGYENGFTPAILDTLAEKDVKAMFFVTRDFIVKNPDYVKRMKEEGHLVGNHTVRHLSSPSLTPEELEAELLDVARAMEELTGYELDPFFRPPMGEYSERTLKVTQDMGYTSVFWSIAYYDYDVNDQPGKEYVTDHFATYHHNGSIVLMHNISESNTQALGEVIDILKKEQYRFAALTELTERE